MTKKSLKKEELEVLFPYEEVELMEGLSIEVRPLSLHNLPKVADSFGTIMNLVEAKKTPSEIAARAIQEVLLLIEYCIDYPPEQIPASVVPDLLEVVIKQNMSEDVLGKWMTLIQKMQSLGEEKNQSQKKSPSQG